jgi:hypothetical protein
MTKHHLSCDLLDEKDINYQLTGDILDDKIII